ncbi:hypothetical protein Bbelb_250700 [Branchiostoma belcheri]|nr:hypothetical protein Bbelb_250700 [Branchiostoma belcheri]
MAVHRVLALLFLIVVPHLVVEGCWPSKIEKRPMSRCEKERAESRAGRGKMFVKQCAPDGSYSTMQCAWKGDFCYCAHPDTGVLFPETRMRGQPFGCDTYYILREDQRTQCEKQMFSANPDMLPGGFIKECEADGSFKKEQCNPDGLCFCVNKETGELYGQTGTYGQINCAEYEASHDEPKIEAQATLCEKQQFSRNPAMLPGGFIKVCEPDGSFRKEQCSPEGPCFCVNTETGEIYPSFSSTSGQFDCAEYQAMVPPEEDEDERTPCEAQKDSDNPAMLPGGFIKQCEADGSFKKEQCSPEGLCYCVNKETGELYGQTGSPGQINCAEYEAMHAAGENWHHRG